MNSILRNELHPVFNKILNILFNLLFLIFFIYERFLIFNLKFIHYINNLKCMGQDGFQFKCRQDIDCQNLKTEC